MRSFRFPRWTLLLASTGAAGPLFASHEAAAGWPPPEGATSEDMAKSDNWPNDPDYGFSDESDGAWNYYSFLPFPLDNLRAGETASGMSIDLAWRYTIGDPDIRIVVTDSGIEWEKPDLVDKVWLNQGELGGHKPTHADGTPCDAPDALLAPELLGFDCNGDHTLSVSDYAETPTLLPEATEGHPKGDRNQNGILDAGDLILNLSDGIDDDQNGYVDDISGWDFMKDDNDPFDDTRYGHGTGEAHDSTAQANNGIGNAGVCPLCKFVPTRAGDSFITDVNDFAEAVVYATDTGASVVQCALGTINMNRFAQAALDYAYDRGVLVITSMADENARHHNMPAASNHTLPVHAIQYDANNMHDSTTFFAYHPCSNYGGQNFLSASGTSCSSEATGRLSGIAGLLYAAAKKFGVAPLSAGEAQQLLMMNTDDIDVKESQDAASIYRWSQTGFDQRFGYGRVNANRSIEALKSKRLPPAVDITSPTWFSVLYPDQVSGPVDIVGTIAAPRASSYGFVAEWGPGVQPLDAEFHKFAEQDNIDPTVVMGGKDGTLASLDVRTIDPTHERDVDSPHGENDFTITVRIRAVAHYGGQVGDVPGEMRRTYYVHKDESLAKGFPLFVGDSGESSPKMADIDGDGVRDLVYPTSGGVVHVLRLTPTGPEPVAGFPFRASVVDGLVDPPPTPTIPSYLTAPGYATRAIDVSIAREAFTEAPAVGDLDGDGKNEIVVSTWSGTIYVIGSDGKVRTGWPKRLPEVPSCPLDPTAPPVSPCMSEKSRIARGAFAAPVLADLDGDKKLDVIQAAFDGSVYVFDADGTPVRGWPAEVHYTGDLVPEPDRNRILTTPAIGDFNDDGVPDLFVGSNEMLGESKGAGAVYLLDGRGTSADKLVLPGYPISMLSLNLFPLVAEGVANSGVIARFDGTLATVSHGNASLPFVLPADPGAQPQLSTLPAGALPARPDPDNPGQTKRGVDSSSLFGKHTKVHRPNTMLPLFAQPSVGDIDQDGVPDIVASGGSLGLAIALQSQSGGEASLGADHLLAVWSGKTGAMLPGSPFLLEDFTFFNSQAIADLNGDDYPEVITGSGGYYVHAFDGCGREPLGWPKFTGQSIIPTVAVGDLDGDHVLEVATGTRSGWLYVWHTEAPDTAIIEWESFHHDNHNTGNLETPLEQGDRTRKASTPLTDATCELAPEETRRFGASGGCDCRVVGRSEDERARLALVGVAALLGAALRRRRASLA